MSRDKQIEKMAKTVCHLDRTCDQCMTSFECKAMVYAKRFYDAGYRKIDDDHARQCTCYALGCQMAETLKREVARGIFAEIEEGISAAVSALQFENNPIHRKVKHETYSSLMRFIKTIEQKYAEHEPSE